MIKDITHRNGSIIPSRSEKRSKNVKWGVVNKNMKLLGGLQAEEKCFAWKLCQDMLPVGARVHRRNAEKRCLATLEDGSQCHEIQDRDHVFRSCNAIVGIYDMIIQVVNRLTERSIGYDLLVHLAFNHRNKKRLKCALWVAVKIMYMIYLKKKLNKRQILTEMIKEIDWNLSLNRKVGSEGDMVKLKDILMEMNNAMQ